MPKTLDLDTIITPEKLATNIAVKFSAWETAKGKWEESARETLQYLYATSTSDISTQPKEYDNKTHIPKLTQIRDMLITYYLDAMFSLPDYVEWEAYSEDTVNLSIKNKLKAVSRQLLRDSNFKDTVKALVEDYVDYGVCFSVPTLVSDKIYNKNGEETVVYNGPKAFRISPLDIFFDPTAASFDKSPKIIRKLTTIGELMADVDYLPDDNYTKTAVQESLKKRQTVRDALSTSNADTIKSNELEIAGVGKLSDYYMSDTVELLTFFGDIYDINENKLYRNSKIVVIDRSKVIYNEPIQNLGYGCNIFKSGWRDRKDSLWSMSPLDNLKGMQYMIDFLENKRADIFNFISDPIIITKGDVELPEYMGPGAEINCDKDSDAAFARPDATVLQADTYVNRYMMLMEEMAGTPREAMGFRTPGEKTAFEVSQLNTASSRLFNEKVKKFEREMLEPLLTSMIRLYLNSGVSFIKVETVAPNGAKKWEKIDLSTLEGDGKFVAVGSDTYTEKARIAQTLMQLGNSGIYMDELVRNNFDPEIIAYILTVTTGLDKYPRILRENARVSAQLKMQQAADSAQQLVEEQQVRSMENVQQAPL